MSRGAVRARCLVIASAISALAYAASSPGPAWALLGVALLGVGVFVTSPLVGLRVSRTVAGVATLGVLVVTLSRIVNGDLDIHTFGLFVVWMMVVKSFDRRHAGDDAQLLAFAIFLAVASMLLNNGLVVAVLTLAFLPFAVHAAMQLQLRLSHERAHRLARRGAPGACVPAIRPAAGPAAGPSLVRTSVAALLLGLVFAATVFVIVPRGPALRRLAFLPSPGAGRVVGFADRVRVGEGGVVSASNTPVLLLRLTDAEGQPFGGAGSAQYLRGAVLDRYEGGVWFTSGDPSQAGEPGRVIADEARRFRGTGDGPTLVQDITLLNTPPDYKYLFTLWRPVSLTPREAATISIYGPHGSVMAATRGGRLRYTVESVPFDSPYRRRRSREEASWASPVVAGAARDILARAGIDPDPASRAIADDGLAIRAFQQHFWTHYTYSLGEPPPPAGAEPIEWFLTAGERGHCELYASSLAALCRSVGIPARVVTGYVAAEYDRATGHYVVRQSNAHAWVEAQYEPGLWKTYDATPPSDLMRIHGPKPGVLAGLGRVFDTLNYRWISSIVSFDGDARRDMLSWSEPASGEFARQARRALDSVRVTTPNEVAVLALRLFVGMASGVLGLYGLGTLLRRWWRARSRRPAAIARRIGDAAVRERVRGTPLYQEMLTTLARAGLRKPEWQPLRDWGHSLGAYSAELGTVVGELADLFYILRFGGRELTSAEHARAGELLAGLRATAAQGGRS